MIKPKSPRTKARYAIRSAVPESRRAHTDSPVLLLTFEHPDLGQIRGGDVTPRELFTALTRAGLIVPAKEATSK